MTLYTALSEVPAGYGPSVVTIGNFDGVHRGHARVISRVVSLAEEHGLSSIAVSFDPHPMQVHRPEAAHHDIMGQGFAPLLHVPAGSERLPAAEL